ncbi:MAG: TrbI/VirB10 family protein [Pseudomonadota bacterium]|nr:TrbI/VirB10 family protein [Pseudomonadota bacterium]
MEPNFADPAEAARPLVARPVSNRGLWAFAAVLLIAAIGLFSSLEARRSAVTSPATMYNPGQSSNVITAPPALAVPQSDPYAGEYYTPTIIPRAVQLPTFIPQTLPGVPRTPHVAQTGSIPGPPIARQPTYYDAGSPDAAYRPPQAGAAAPVAPAEDTSAAVRTPGGRVLATRLANPSLTVQQGTVIQAVLETALDSNRPGFVRAIVSRDVRSFDGSRVLIPRGSRLFGEYKSDLGQGQSRVLVQWQKLTRPDGVQIALDSPAADPLGRAGIGGKVNTHFFARFASALLQSTLDIGVGLATRSAGGGTVVLGLPGSTQNLVQPNQENLKPTVTVKQGTSVSVFVAHDLDFSTVE